MSRLIRLLLAIYLFLGGCQAWHPSPLPAPPPFTPLPSPTATPTPSIPQRVIPTPLTLTSTPTPLPTATPHPPASPNPGPTLTPLHLDLVEQATALLPWAQADLTGLEHLTQYSIELTVDMKSLLIRGREQVRYTNTEDVPLDRVVFRLFPQTPGYGGQMRVDEVLIDGETAATQLAFKDSALYVLLPQPLDPGETVTFQLAFRVGVPKGTEVGYGQFSYADGILSLPEVYPLIPVYDDEGWNVELAPDYGDAVYSDVALYRVQVRAPSDQVVATSGSIVERVDQGDGTAITTAVSGPMRDFALVISSNFITSTTTVNGTVVTSYYLPEDKEGGERALRYASDALRVFSELFGPYPYAEFDVVETPTTAGGIEYPGLVVIAQRLYKKSGGFFEFATVHETAHQWWYGLVGSDQVDEPWLDEALVQYSTLLYYEKLRGPEVAEEVRKRAFEKPYEKLLKEGRDEPVGQPVRAFSREDYGPVVYGKGPLFFQALRDKVGDEAFFAILRAYLKAYRYKIATPEGFLSIAERISGQDLDDLYKKWILSYRYSGEPRPFAAAPSVRLPMQVWARSRPLRRAFGRQAHWVPSVALGEVRESDEGDKSTARYHRAHPCRIGAEKCCP